MALPISPPVEPMLARLAREIPIGPYTYEPKWDGFRCLAFVDRDRIDLRSRKHSPFSRYFPELAAALLRVDVTPCVLDGEIMITRGGVPDFDALLKRIHPTASHVARMAADAPASFIAFDLLAADDADLREQPFVERRARLEHLLAGAEPPILLTPATQDPEVATRWLDAAHEGIDGVVAKRIDSTYEPGKRSMVKVKRLRTADCVVAGCRVSSTGGISSLLLGLYDDGGRLHHVGVASGFAAVRRRELVEDVRPFVVPLAQHPWAEGFATEGGAMGRLPGSAGRWTPDMELDWIPLRPELVCEATFDQVDGQRWRHPGRFVRWRPDRDASSCLLDQLEPAGGTT